MRNLTLTLTTEDGKLQVSESTGWHDGWGISTEWIQLMLDDLKKHLDALEVRSPVPIEPGYPVQIHPHDTAGLQKALDMALKK